MNERKWTPGPWSQFETCVYIGRTGDVNDDGSPNWGGFDLRNCPSPTENAHLIAAAPDLYDALEVLLSHVETSEDVGNEVWIETHHKHVDAAFKALAKARGKT